MTFEQYVNTLSYLTAGVVVVVAVFGIALAVFTWLN